jgi:hypothetical protein
VIILRAAATSKSKERAKKRAAIRRMAKREARVRAKARARRRRAREAAAAASPPAPKTKPKLEPPPKPAASNCDPNYEGACLDPSASDYDCAGGSGDGPKYTGTVTVVGDDHYDLNRDDDNIACEP